MCSQLITEQAEISLTRGAEVKGRCGHNESELQVFWVDRAYTLKMLFVKVIRCGDRRGMGSAWVCAVVASGVAYLKAIRRVHRSLPILAGKSQHFQRTRGDLEAEQGAICL